MTQCPDRTPVKLREAEKSTTDQERHELTRHLHGWWRSERSGCGGVLCEGSSWNCGGGKLGTRSSDGYLEGCGHLR